MVLPGLGHLFDVGHLVFSESTGETLQASNNVVGRDQPFDLGAEICRVAHVVARAEPAGTTDRRQHTGDLRWWFARHRCATGD